MGSIDSGAQSLDIRAVGALTGTDDVQQVVVAQQAAGPVLVRDVATVEEGYKDLQQLQRLNGEPAVGLSIVKASTANALDVADGIRSTLDRLKPLLPAGATFHVTNDSSVFTRAALDAVQSDLILAVVLVALVVLAFLHAWRNAAIIVLAIPTSMISTFLLMFLMGFTLNLMTLMALALTVGILVDDSTVVIENIHRHLARGEAPVDAALRGRAEIGLAALAITAADIVVYSPIAFMSGLVGQLFRQYGLTVVAATVLSFLISFTLTPMLASRWMRHETHATGPLSHFGLWWDRHFESLARFAERVVPLAIEARWSVVLGGILLLCATIGLVQLRLVGTEYAPGEDSGVFQVSVLTPAGTSLQGTDLAAKQVEDALLKIPEVRNVFSSVSVGAAGLGSGTGGTARLVVQLSPKSERGRSVFDIVDQTRRIGRDIAGARVVPSVPSSLPGGGRSGGLDFSVSGPDIDVLNQVVQTLEVAAAQIPGLRDVQDTAEQGAPNVEVIFDRRRMAQLGVTAQQAVSALRTTLGGTVVTELRRPGKVQQDITVVADDSNRKDLTTLASIPVRGGAGSSAGSSGAEPGGSGTGGTSSGGGATNADASGGAGPLITLGQIATIQPGTGPVQIQRTNRNRTISVSGTAVGRPLGDVAADLRGVLASTSLPPGYTATAGNQVNRFNDALTALLQALALALVLEYMLLVALYESLFYPLVLIVSVPLGLVGSILGLLVTGNTINIFSLMGLIMAFGLVAKNGILLVDFANQLRRQGIARTEALAAAARARLRPILMTSATMLFGMLPLSFKLESGAESRAPMAVVVIGAVISSTLLAVIVLPAIYTLFDDLQVELQRRMGPTLAATRRRLGDAAPTRWRPALVRTGLLSE